MSCLFSLEEGGGRGGRVVWALEIVNTSNVSILVVINQIVFGGNNGPVTDFYSMPYTEVAVMAADIISLFFWKNRQYLVVLE